MEMARWDHLFGRFVSTILVGLFSSRAPIFRPSEAADDRSLPGIYAPMRVVENGRPAPIHETLAVKRRSPGIFTLTFSEDGKTMRAFDARLYEVAAKGKVPQRYFDLTPLPAPKESKGDDMFPRVAHHHILLFEFEDGRLDLRAFDPEKLAALAKKAAVSFAGEPYTITASSSEARRFFLNDAPEALSNGATLYQQRRSR